MLNLLNFEVYSVDLICKICLLVFLFLVLQCSFYPLFLLSVLCIRKCKAFEGNEFCRKLPIQLYAFSFSDDFGENMVFVPLDEMCFLFLVRHCSHLYTLYLHQWHCNDLSWRMKWNPYSFPNHQKKKLSVRTNVV